MADVSIKYNNTEIAALSATGTKTCKTSGKYCEKDLVIEYTKPSAELEDKTITAITVGTAVTPTTGKAGMSQLTLNSGATATVNSGKSLYANTAGELRITHTSNSTGNTYVKPYGASSYTLIAEEGSLLTPMWDTRPSAGTSLLQEFTPSTSAQYYENIGAGWLESGKYIKINAANLQAKSPTNITIGTAITPDSGYLGLSSFTLNGGGTITIPSGKSTTISNSGTTTTFNNNVSGTITTVYQYGTVGTLSNGSGGTITTLTNSGTITTLTNSASKTISTLTNNGTIGTLAGTGTISALTGTHVITSIGTSGTDGALCVKCSTASTNNAVYLGGSSTTDHGAKYYFDGSNGHFVQVPSGKTINLINVGTIGSSSSAYSQNSGTMYIAHTTGATGNIYVSEKTAPTTYAQVISNGALKQSSWQLTSTAPSGSMIGSAAIPALSAQYFDCNSAGWTALHKYVKVNPYALKFTPTTVYGNTVTRLTPSGQVSWWRSTLSTQTFSGYYDIGYFTCSSNAIAGLSSQGQSITTTPIFIGEMIYTNATSSTDFTVNSTPMFMAFSNNKVYLLRDNSSSLFYTSGIAVGTSALNFAPVIPITLEFTTSATTAPTLAYTPITTVVTEVTGQYNNVCPAVQAISTGKAPVIIPYKASKTTANYYWTLAKCTLINKTGIITAELSAVA